MHDFDETDTDGSGGIDKSELTAIIEKGASFPSNGYAIISEELWNSSLDMDGDGLLNAQEFLSVAHRLAQRTLFVEPVLVFPPRKITYDFDLFTVQSVSAAIADESHQDARSQVFGKACENFIVRRSTSAHVPYSSEGWNEWYDELSAEGGGDVVSKIDHCRPLEDAEFDAIVVGDQTSVYATPLLATSPGSNKIFVDLDAALLHDVVQDDPQTLLARVSRPGLDVALWSTRQLPEIVHVFNKNDVVAQAGTTDDTGDLHETGTIFSATADIDVINLELTHNHQVEQKMQDDTTVVVSGAVMFPIEWTELSECGLFEANIYVKDESEAGAPRQFTTDETGWFEFAVTNGKTYTITAEYDGHEICYSGTTIVEATRIWSCDGKPTAVTLHAVSSKKYVFFSDTTTANVDLGVYQGECEKLYTGATFKITPINGCHPPAIFTSAQVSGWTLPDRDKENSDVIPTYEEVPNGRRWPLAAMDYSVVIEEAPSTANFTAMREEKYPNALCHVGVDGIIPYFRQHPTTIERLVPLRTEHTWYSARYKYHGYLCAEFVDLSVITDDGDYCWDVDSAKAGGIKHNHFVGISPFFDDFGGEGLFALGPKVVSAKVLELHVENGSLDECLTLPSAESGGMTVAMFRQSVTDIAENPCHTDRNGGPLCDFDVEIDPESDKLLFPTDEGEKTTDRLIVAGDPKLSGNYRRSVELTVGRFDGSMTVTVPLKRELISLGSKPRGEGIYGEESDDVYWATVPLEGLVYMTVHDPPGGNSYAELLMGTEVTMSVELSDEQAASVSSSHEGGGGVELEMEAKPGFGAGYGMEVLFQLGMPLFKIDFDAYHEESGPEFSVAQSSAVGWDLTATINRVIRTSTDVAIPGRHGDAILGGGVELVYRLADTLDLALREDDKPCLRISTAITWMPRKPTSYIFTVHSIEAKVIPNLRYLLSVVESGLIVGDDSKMEAPNWPQYITDRINVWQRTLLWASPTVYKVPMEPTAEGAPVLYGKNYGAMERIMIPFMDEQSAFGMEAEKMETSFISDASGPISTPIDELKLAWKRIDRVSPYIHGVPGDLGDADGTIDTLNDFILSDETDESRSSQLISGYLSNPGTLFSDFLSGNLGFRGDDDDNDATPDVGKVFWSRKSDRMKPKFLEQFQEADELVTTMGMNSPTREDLNNTVSSCITEKCKTQALDVSSQLLQSSDLSDLTLGEDASINMNDTKRVDASFTGRMGPRGYSTTDSNGPADEAILLSFSGGGASTEYIFSSNENVDGQDYAWTLSLDGSAENGYSFAGSIAIVKGHVGATTDMSKSVSKSRAFAWAKYEHMSTMYSLGDPDFGDKFVLQVSSDKRFGSPVFITMGGRSQCPGEKWTMFREAGVTIGKESTHNTNLNPGEHALIQLLISNESPYKEVADMGLRLVDGVADCVGKIIAAAHNAAQLNEDNATFVKNAAYAMADSHECFASESDDIQDLKARIEDIVASYEQSLSVRAGRLLANAIARLTQTTTAQGTLLQGMKFSINGIQMWSFGEVLPLRRLAGERMDSQSVVRESRVLLSVEPSDGVYESSYLGISLVSLCESMIEEYMYRPIISSSVTLGAMSWSKDCPQVAFHSSTLSKEASYFEKSAASDSSVLSISVVNPNRYSLWPKETASTSEALVTNGNLAYVYVQYRSVSGGEWITAKDAVRGAGTNKNFNLLCPESRGGDGCIFDWDLNDPYNKLLSGYKDGKYDIRLKTMCVGGSHLAKPSVHEFVSDQNLMVKIDTKDPLVGDFKYVSSQVTQRVDFMEDIDCTKQVITAKRGNSSTGPFEAVSNEDLRQYVLQCVNDGAGGHWLMKFPYFSQGYHKVTVTEVTDVAGNPAAEFEFVAPVRVGASTAETPQLGSSGSSPRQKSSLASSSPEDDIDGSQKVAIFYTPFAFTLCVALFAFAFRARVRPADAEMSERTSLVATTSRQVDGYSSVI